MSAGEARKLVDTLLGPAPFGDLGTGGTPTSGLGLGPLGLGLGLPSGCSGLGLGLTPSPLTMFMGGLALPQDSSPNLEVSEPRGWLEGRRVRVGSGVRGRWTGVG